MDVRYKPAWGITLTTLGVLALGLGVVLTMMGGRPHIGTFISGGVSLIAGVGYLRRHYCRLTEDELQIPAVLGPLVKRYALEQPGDLTFANSKVWYRGKKLGLTPTMARADDWAAFVAHVGRRAQAEVFD